MNPGIFITFEGIDGSGKTTQLRILAERLRQAGHDVIETVEPGGTAIGREIRAILLDGRNTHLTPRAELLLYFASRAQNVAEVIRPALAAGKIVLCDRFTDSTLVYQGCGRGLGANVVLALHQIACEGLQPDLTVFVDIDLDEETWPGLGIAMSPKPVRKPGSTTNRASSIRRFATPTSLWPPAKLTASW